MGEAHATVDSMDNWGGVTEAGVVQLEERSSASEPRSGTLDCGVSVFVEVMTLV